MEGPRLGCARTLVVVPEDRCILKINKNESFAKQKASKTNAAKTINEEETCRKSSVRAQLLYFF